MTAFLCSPCVERDPDDPKPHNCRDDGCGCQCRRELVAVTLRLPRDLHEALAALAEEEERHLSQLLRIAAKRYLRAAGVPSQSHRSDVAEPPPSHRADTAEHRGDGVEHPSRTRAALDLDLLPEPQKQTPPVSPPEGTANGSKPKPPPNRRKPAHTLPPDWQPSDAHRSLALAEGVDCDREAARFRDYAEANDWRKVNWEATFRNWLRSPYNANGANGVRGSPNGSYDVATAEVHIWG